MPRRPDMPALDRGDLDLDPIAQFQAWFELAEREVPLRRGDDPGDRRRRRRPGRAHGAAQGGRPARVSLLHQPRVVEGGRSSPPRARAALVVYWRELDRQVRVRGRGRAARRRGVRRLLRHPAPRLAARRLGLAAVAADRPRATELDQLSTRPRRGSPRARSRGPTHWGGYLLCPRRSSSGRAGSGGCTTASATPASARGGGSSGWRRRAPGARRGSMPRGELEQLVDVVEVQLGPQPLACDARTLTPWPKASSSASSARSIAACWSGWATTFGRRRRLRGLGPALGLAHRPARGDGVAGEAAADLVALRDQDRPAVALAERALGEQVEHVVGEVEQPDQVRDRGAGAAEAAGELLLREPELVDQRRRRRAPRRPGSGPRGRRSRSAPSASAGPRPRRGRSPAPSRARPRAPRASAARRRSARSGRRGAVARAAAGSIPASAIDSRQGRDRLRVERSGAAGRGWAGSARPGSRGRPARRSRSRAGSPPGPRPMPARRCSRRDRLVVGLAPRELDAPAPGRPRRRASRARGRSPAPRGSGPRRCGRFSGSRYRTPVRLDAAQLRLHVLCEAGALVVHGDQHAGQNQAPG